MDDVKFQTKTYQLKERAGEKRKNFILATLIVLFSCFPTESPSFLLALGPTNYVAGFQFVCVCMTKIKRRRER